MTYKENIGIIGHPIGHSKSPIFQQVALDYHNIQEKFTAWDISDDELPKIVEHFKSKKFIASCITLPHKLNIMKYVDNLTDTAKKVGAVNWIFNKEGKLTGHNTDCSGFIRSLKDQTGLDPNSKNALVFGAGGACRAIVYGLKNSGINSITLSNRTTENAEKIASDFSDNNFLVNVIDFEKKQIDKVARDVDLIVNTSSLGMTGGPAPNTSPIYSDSIRKNIVGYDIVYAPIETPFLKEIKSSGGITGNGISMLVYQGIEGFEMATGLNAPVEKMFEAFRKA